MRKTILFIVMLFFGIKAGQKQDVVDILTGYVGNSDDAPQAVISFDEKEYTCIGYRPHDDLYWYCKNHQGIKILHDESERVVVDILDSSHRDEEELIFEMEDI